MLLHTRVVWHPPGQPPACVTTTRCISLTAFCRNARVPSSCTRFFFVVVSATLHYASAPLLTYKSRFVERDLPSTSVISKCTCSSPTPGAIQWSSLQRRDQRLDHSLPLPSPPASPMPGLPPWRDLRLGHSLQLPVHLHLRCQVFPRGEIYVSATHYHFQSTCIADARSSPVARSTSRPLTVTSSPPAPPMPGLLPWRDLRLGHSLQLPVHLHLRCQVSSRGEIYASATHYHFQPTCISDSRSTPCGEINGSATHYHFQPTCISVRFQVSSSGEIYVSATHYNFKSTYLDVGLYRQP